MMCSSKNLFRIKYAFVVICLLASVRVNAVIITTDNSDPSYSITSSIDYETISTGTNLQPEVVVVNTGSNELVIGAVADVNPVSDPYSLPVDGCANTTLSPGERCAIIPLYAPNAPGTYPDSFNIEFPGLSQTYTVNLTGAAADTAPVPDILLSFTSIDFGDVDIGAILPEFPQLLQSTGDSDLTLSSISLNGADASDFNVTTGPCLGVSPLAPGKFCTVSVGFTPATIGKKTARIEIYSDDPDENPFVTELYANVRGEVDGVPAFIEDNGLNNGDGDYDGILDSEQSNIASLLAANNTYVSLVADSTNAFRDVMIINESSFVAHPDINIRFDYGVFDFTLEASDIVSIGIMLPVSLRTNSFYMYGPTSDNSNQHWYEFMFDADTGLGAQIFENSLINEADNARRNLVILVVEDGGLGDSDLMKNGKIRIQGAVSTTSGEGSGMVGFYVLFFIAIVMCLRCVLYKKRKIDHRLLSG